MRRGMVAIRFAFSLPMRYAFNRPWRAAGVNRSWRQLTTVGEPMFA